MKTILKILLCFCAFIMAHQTAMAEQAYIYLKDQIPGLRLYLKTPTVEKYKGMFEIVNQNTDDYVYCIEPGVILKNGYFTSYQMLNKVDLSYEITTEDWNYLRTIANYGYGYEDRTDIKWYAATQFLIWEYILEGKGEVYFVDENNQKTNPLKEEIAAIQNDLAHHEDIPSFLEDDELITLNIGDTITLQDKNDILDRFSIEGRLVDIKIDNDQLTLHFPKPGSHQITFKKYFTNESVPKIYASTDNQAVINRGIIDTPFEVLEVYVKMPSFKLIKTSSNEGGIPIKGAKYRIYYEDGSTFGDITTDKNGEAYIDEIYQGRYYLKEIEAPYGYHLDSSKIEFEVGDENVVIKCEDERIFKEIEVEKYLENIVGSYELESHATFEIYDEKDKLITTVQTNEYGKFTLTLPYGTYTLHQIDGMEGYQLVEDITLTVNASTKDELIIKNPQIKGSLLIEKKDIDNDQLILDEATFKVLNTDTNKYLEVDGEDVFATIEGKIYINNIPYGNYKLVEVEAPKGYKLSQEQYFFTIDEESETIEISVYNELLTGSLLIEKKDLDTHELILDEAVFQLINIDTNEYYEVDGSNVLITQNGKLLIEDLPFGNYKLIEVLAPHDYEISSKEYFLVIDKEDETIISIYNELLTGSLLIEKKDIDSDQLILDEATFKVLNTDTNKYLEVDGEDVFATIEGKIYINNIPYGNYKLVEVEAPKGYKLSQEQYFFTIDEESETIEISVYNELLTGSLLIEKKDIDSDQLILDEATFKVLNTDTNKYLEVDGEDVFATIEGKIYINNIPYGNYKLIEVEAPKGYNILESERNFIINKEESFSVVVYNEKAKGTLEIIKLDEENLEPLQGVLFGLYNEKQELMKEYLTNQEGKIIVQDLLPGIYYIKELDVSSEYELLDGFSEIEIKENVHSSVKITNRLKIEVPKTGTNELILTILLSSSCLFIGSFICNYDKKR